MTTTLTNNNVHFADNIEHTSYTETSHMTQRPNMNYLATIWPKVGYIWWHVFD